MCGWTGDTNEALDFQNTSRAIEFWRDNDLLNVQIVLKYAQTKHDVVLDVLPRRDGVASPWQSHTASAVNV